MHAATGDDLQSLMLPARHTEWIAAMASFRSTLSHCISSQLYLDATALILVLHSWLVLAAARTHGAALTRKCDGVFNTRTKGSRPGGLCWAWN
jgi:hypothetical protein